MIHPQTLLPEIPALGLMIRRLVAPEEPLAMMRWYAHSLPEELETNVNQETLPLLRMICATLDSGVEEMRIHASPTLKTMLPVLILLLADLDHTVSLSTPQKLVQSVPRLDPSLTENRSALPSHKFVLP